MAITAYSGLMGHGKSYGVVKHVILPAIKDGRTVFTNIPLDNELFIKDFGNAPVHFELSEIKDSDDWWNETLPSGALLVIDEVWRLWPAGQRANQIPECDRSFLAEHRHRVGDDGKSTEIVLVTQDLAQLASFAKNLVETTYRVVKMNKLGRSDMYRVDIFDGPVTGPRPPLKNRIREQHGGKYKQEIYQYYSSHTQSETGEAGDETQTDDRFNIFKGSGPKIMIMSVLVLSLLAFLGLSNLKDSYSGKSETTDNPEEIIAVKNTVDSGIKKTVEKLKFPNYLSDSDSAYISLSNGVYPRIKFFFRVNFNGGSSDLSSGELTKLGYSVKPINSCLVRVTGHDFDSYLACNKPEKDTGFFNVPIPNADDSI